MPNIHEPQLVNLIRHSAGAVIFRHFPAAPVARPGGRAASRKLALHPGRRSCVPVERDAFGYILSATAMAMHFYGLGQYALLLSAEGELVWIVTQKQRFLATQTLRDLETRLAEWIAVHT